MIKVTCNCGAAFNARENFAGKRVKCRSCGKALTVPLTVARLLAECQCGKAFMASPKLEGKRVKCPGCNQFLTIPSSPPSLVPFSNNPFGDNGSFGDAPLRTPAALPSEATLPHATTWSDPVAQTRTLTRADARLPVSALGIAAGIFAIIHAVTTYSALIPFIQLLLEVRSMMDEFGIKQFPLPFHTIALTIAQAVVATGVLVGGTAILFRQKWGVTVGAISSCGYFLLIGINLLIGLVTLLRLGSIEMPSGVETPTFARSILPLLLWSLIYVARNSIGPVLLLVLHQRRRNGTWT